MELILATSNSHKAEEFNELFKDSGIKIVAANDKIEVIEDGFSYFDNALLKAKAYFKKYGAPVIADDSGLNVEALPGQLGIHSARFGGEGLDDKDRAKLLLEKLKGQEFRQAYFTCVLCIYLSEEEYYFFEGRMQGVIGDEYVGQTGFGYDPIFIPNELITQKQTVSENHEWKKLNSHRALAVKAAYSFLKQRIS